MAWLALTHVAALALLGFAPFWWVAQDAAAIAANGSQDSLHATFHRQRLSWRVGVALLVAGLASLPALPHAGAFVMSAAGLLAIGTAWHAFIFNPALNVARKLPYVARYYVSADPRAAFMPDRFLWQRAVAAFPDHGQLDDPIVAANRQAHAADELHRLLRAVLGAGLVGYVLALAYLFFTC